MIILNNDLLFKNGENEAHASLGHEMGHRVQDVQNRMRGRPRVDVELEADALLGVYAKSLKDEGRLPEGLVDAAILSRRNARQDADHGTPEQRVSVWFVSYHGGFPPDNVAQIPPKPL